MTKYGEKGSTYRGRLLYSIETHDDENPKSATTDLTFTFPRNPEPSTPEKTYIIKCALYEGIELPDNFKEYSFHIACGPYEVKSKVKK